MQIQVQSSIIIAVEKFGSMLFFRNIPIAIKDRIFSELFDTSYKFLTLICHNFLSRKRNPQLLIIPNKRRSLGIGLINQLTKK